MCFFSVVIPLYNKEDDVAGTISSVLNQEHQNFELIIIDDGSTDNSVGEVEKFNDKRISIYQTHNKGVSAARNLGVEYAQSDYITFLDADDTWKTNHLITLKRMIELHPNHGWYGTSYCFISKRKNTQPCILYNNWPKDWQGLITDFFILNRTQWLIHICSICVNKKVFYEVGMFNEDISCQEDIDFFIRMALQSPLFYQNTITMKYNPFATNRSSDLNFKDKKIIDLKMYANEEKKRRDLKLFLDFFRYTQYITFETTSNHKWAEEAKKEISIENLTKLQRFLIRMPKSILIVGLWIKRLLASIGISFNISNLKQLRKKLDQ